ncbi:MAG: [Fe-Fe] hydrogenase large subunit C-terminal domain-containing protein [Clostridia bacterium]
MNSVLQFKKANCKNCYKCIRNCPVKSIKVSDHQANIIDNECILCGVCTTICPQNAKSVRSDIDKVKQLIKSGEHVYCSLAPSFVADFNLNSLEDCRDIFDSLGFYETQETAIGAHIVKTEYEKLIKQADGKPIISSCCHSVNLLISKYFPAALSFLAKVISPMAAHGRYIKQKDKNAKVVFIGPCVSKKEEATGEFIDYVLTFDELYKWMDSENLAFKKDNFKTPDKKLSRFFPTAGGIIKTMDTENSNYSYIAVDGPESCVAVLKELEKGKITNCFIEMSACKGSCVGGPITKSYAKNSIRSNLLVEQYANSKDDFLIKAKINLNKNFSFLGTGEVIPGEDEIIKTLKKMGKHTSSDELNCGTCGYNTCREKAIAVCQGKADLTMCLPYLKEKAESFSDNILNNTPNVIFAIDEDLNIQQLNKAACKMFGIKNYKDKIGSPIFDLLNPARYICAMEKGFGSSEERYYLAEYDKYVEEFIVYDKNYKMIISIMKDITDVETQEKQKEQLQLKTAEITDKMIEKQMRVVQEIASLLGETTAETKIALTNLKKVLTENSKSEIVK